MREAEQDGVTVIDVCKKHGVGEMRLSRRPRGALPERNCHSELLLVPDPSNRAPVGEVACEHRVLVFSETGFNRVALVVEQGRRFGGQSARYAVFVAADMVDCPARPHLHELPALLLATKSLRPVGSIGGSGFRRWQRLRVGSVELSGRSDRSRSHCRETGRSMVRHLPSSTRRSRAARTRWPRRWL
ncbi:MAG: hypothetical protein GY762_09540 [Proteobacteria bacterium]|nr:hypothetical protein [Pseudomonadota bacterium]